MKRPPKKVTMEEARKAHHIRWPLLSQGTSGENGMITFILEIWTEGSGLNFSRFLDIFVFFPPVPGRLPTSTHKESSQSVRDSGAWGSSGQRPLMPQRLSHVEVAHRSLFCRLIWLLCRIVKVESTPDRPRKVIMIKKKNSPEIQDVTSVEAHSWLAIRVIHRSARKNITFFSQTLRIREALPTVKQTGVLMEPDRACGSSPGDGSTLSSTLLESAAFGSLDFNSAAQRALLNAHLASQARRLPTSL